MELFRPVFAGKIVQIKELWVVKELSPGFSGALLVLIPFYQVA
jgi:hypothetical protein